MNYQGVTLFSLLLIFASISPSAVLSEEEVTPNEAETKRTIFTSPPKEMIPAIKAFEAQNYSEADIKLKKAKGKLRPSFYDQIYFLGGLIDLQENDFNGAKKYFTESLKKRGKNSDALHGLGVTYHQLGQFTEAEITLKEAIWFGKYTYYSPSKSWLALSIVYKSLGNEVKRMEAISKIDRKQRPALIEEVPQEPLLNDLPAETLPFSDQS